MDHKIIDISQQQSSVLSWKNLSYNIKTKKHGMREILSDNSGCVYPGEMVAIMGPSGAGKTTLINALSGRIVGGKLSGDIKFNGERRVPGAFKRLLAYVEQDDLMHAQLTVEETLMISAQLRLSNKNYTLAGKRERVETAMQQLRLTKVKDTKIGGDGARGVSGGERKRTSIGIELATDPSILVLDEPISGLDSSSAEMVVSLTKEITRQHNLCTLMTIHQPSPEMVAQFDKLILLAQGKLVYMGPANQALEYFENLGYPSTHPNPANFFIDLTTIDYSSDETIEEGNQRIQQLVDSFAELRAEDDITIEKVNPLTYQVPPRNSWWHEMSTLLKRDLILVARNWGFFWGFVSQSLSTLIFMGFVSFQVDYSQSSIQNRKGLLSEFAIRCVFQVGFPILTVIASGHTILYRERSTGSYRISSYLCAKSLSFCPLIYSLYTVTFTGMYFISHLQYEPGKFFIGLANMYAIIFAAMGMFSIFAVAVRNPGVGTIAALFTVRLVKYMNGYFVNINSITPVLRWFRYISYIYYGYSGFMQNEMDGLKFICKAGDAACFHTGEDVLDAFVLDEVRLWLCIVANLALGIGFYIITYFLLRWKLKLRYLWI